MKTLGSKGSLVLVTVTFSVIAVAVALTLIFAGRYLFGVAGKKVGDFYALLGELCLQLAVVVIVGALVKAAMDWGASQRSRYMEKLDTRKEFMKRVRAMHVTVQNAKDLLNAHQSAKTWSEQSRRLIELRPIVEEISEDLRASSNLFTKQSEICEGLDEIVSFLDKGLEEYVRSHSAVDGKHKAGQSLSATINEANMNWIKDFMAGGDGYQTNYVANLTKSKGAMRRDVYGA